jgi:hypothetical protein
VKRDALHFFREKYWNLVRWRQDNNQERGSASVLSEKRIGRKVRRGSQHQGGGASDLQNILFDSDGAIGRLYGVCRRYTSGRHRTR